MIDVSVSVLQTAFVSQNDKWRDFVKKYCVKLKVNIAELRVSMNNWGGGFTGGEEGRVVRVGT